MKETYGKIKLHIKYDSDASKYVMSDEETKKLIKVLNESDFVNTSRINKLVLFDVIDSTGTLYFNIPLQYMDADDMLHGSYLSPVALLDGYFQGIDFKFEWALDDNDEYIDQLDLVVYEINQEINP